MSYVLIRDMIESVKKIEFKFLEGKQLKKRFLLLMATALTAVSLFGCSKISLTEEQNDMIAEYLAGVILRNEVNYTEKLVTPTPIPSPTPKPDVPNPTEAAKPNSGASSSQGNAENTQVNVDFTQVVGIKGLKLNYEKYELMDEIFNGNEYLPAEDKKQYLVVSFSIENTTDQSIKLKLGEQKISYQLDLGEGKRIKSLLTILDNDLRFFSNTIKAKETQTGVVIFQIQKNQSLDSANIIISANSKTATVQLK